MSTFVRCLTFPASRKAVCTFVRLSPVRSTCFALSPDGLLSADRSVPAPLLVSVALRSGLSEVALSFDAADLSVESVPPSPVLRFEPELSLKSDLAVAPDAFSPLGSSLAARLVVLLWFDLLRFFSGAPLWAISRSCRSRQRFRRFRPNGCLLRRRSLRRALAQQKVRVLTRPEAHQMDLPGRMQS